MDVKSYTRWDDYTEARDDMFAATDTKHAPWWVVKTDDKRRAHLNLISHLLSMVPYEKKRRKPVKLPSRRTKDREASYKFTYVPETF
jgi:hypothetical protein